MIAEEQVSPPQTTPIVLSPWLVALGALALYGITLNHWVTLPSLPFVSIVTGWDWHPAPLAWHDQFLPPLFVLVTLPFRILPTALQPLALNALAAVCAALTLALLAASVRLLPHDRTREQRQREPGAFALLTIKGAFIPALFAVLMLAVFPAFWRGATAISSESIDLLVFAFLIYCLLKYRTTQNDRQLMLFAFVYGLGICNNWALIGFFPLFLGALIWIKGGQFFNLRFVGRMILCGIAGLLLCLLVPLMAALGPTHDDFWLVLHWQLGAEAYFVRLVPRWVVAIAALPTLVPLVFAGIRWPTFEGELSAAGNFLNRMMFHLLHIVFLVIPLVTFFTFKYSPNLVMREMPISFLTFYYAAALAIGYFSGYLLLVCGRQPARTWERSTGIKKAFDRLLVGVVYIGSVGAPVALACQSYPHIASQNSRALPQMADMIVQELPAKHAVILSDDSWRLSLVRAEDSRRGQPEGDILIDSSQFSHKDYIQWLIAQYPELKAQTTSPDKWPKVLPSRALAEFIYRMSANHPIYYLHPSFGYYFETLYQVPHGLVYQLERYTNAAAQPPLPSPREIKDNQAFWANVEKKILPSLPPALREDVDALQVRTDYSVDLDFWGTELQKAGMLKAAGEAFAEAAIVNTNNYIAAINGEYNRQLQRGNHQPVDSSEPMYSAQTLYGGLFRIFKYNGPADEPNLDLEWGGLMAESGQLRQAAAMFERRLQLLPGDLPAQLAMAKTYVDTRQPEKALAIVNTLRSNKQVDPWELIRVEALAAIAKRDFPGAERQLQNAVNEKPKDGARLEMLAQVYRGEGYELIHAGKEKQADVCFTNALVNLERELQLLNAESFSEGQNFARVQVLLKKAELQMMTRSFAGAADTLAQIVDIQPDNRTALLNLAIAETQLKRFPAAKDDFNKLRKLMPHQQYVVDYGLAEIASTEKNSADETHYLRQYLKAAPDDTREYAQVKHRLQKLEGH